MTPFHGPSVNVGTDKMVAWGCVGGGRCWVSYILSATGGGRESYTETRWRLCAGKGAGYGHLRYEE